MAQLRPAKSWDDLCTQDCVLATKGYHTNYGQAFSIGMNMMGSLKSDNSKGNNSCLVSTISVFHCVI